MASLDKTVYSGKQFESYVSIQSDALGTNDVSGTLYKIRTPEVQYRYFCWFYIRRCSKVGTESTKTNRSYRNI